MGVSGSDGEKYRENFSSTALFPDTRTDLGAGNGRSFLGAMINPGKERHANITDAWPSFSQTPPSTAHYAHTTQAKTSQSAFQSVPYYYAWFYTHWISLQNESTGQAKHKGHSWGHTHGKSQDNSCSIDLERTSRFICGVAKKNTRDWKSIWCVDRFERIIMLLEMFAVNQW